MEENNMEYKAKKISFYELLQGRNKFDLKRKLDNIYKLFIGKRYDSIAELEVDNVHYYISAIQKIDLNDTVNYDEDTLDWYCYLINIAKVDPAQEIKYGDLSKVINEREEIIDLSENDVDMTQVGPLYDTQFLIDPFYSVVGLGRSVGGTNMWALKKFLSQIFGNVSGLKFAVIPDEKSISDLNSMTLLKSLSYKVAKTTDIDEQQKDSRSEMGDVNLAKALEADEYEFRVKAVSLNQENSKSKIKKIFKNNEFNDIKSIHIEGVKDGQEVLFDLIKNKLFYQGYIEYNRNSGITIRNNFDYLSKAYGTKVDFVRKSLNVEVFNDESENSKE